MDKKTIERHLAQAEEHVALSEDYIDRQHQLIVDLLRSGSRITEAVKLLHALRSMQREHVDDRDRLRAKLAALQSKDYCQA
jgi:hypothetical protein